MTLQYLTFLTLSTIFYSPDLFLSFIPSPSFLTHPLHFIFYLFAINPYSYLRFIEHFYATKMGENCVEVHL